MKPQVIPFTPYWPCLSAALLFLALSPVPAQSLGPFNPAPNGPVYAIAVQPDGKVVIGGTFTSLAGSARARLGRVSADGSLDLAFNPVINGDLYAVVVQPDGKMLVAGNFFSVGGVSRSSIARLNSDGTLDISFSANAGASINALAVQSDGKILVGGLFTTLGGLTQHYLGRLNPDGTIDTTFLPAVSGSVTTITIQPDGRILVGGNFTQLDGAGRNYLGRLNLDGTLDPTFNPGASATVTTLTVQPDGKILVGGNFSSLGGGASHYFGRLDAAGNLDSSFAPQLNGTVYSVALQADGQILIGGSFTAVAGQPPGCVARLHADGTLDTAFNMAANGPVNALALQPDGQVLVGGSFLSLAGQPRNHAARLNNDPATESLTADTSLVTWFRGGTSPELIRASFELTTNGTGWVGLGPVSPGVGGWLVTNLTLPATYAIRARGFVAGGQYNSSGWPVLAAQGIGPAVIVDQPSNQRVALGAAAGFSVLAAGTAPITYQWRKNGQDIPGANDPAYLVPSSTSADGGSYTVAVSNSFGGTVSCIAVLAILHTNMPFAATQPPSLVGQTNATLNGMATPRGYPTLAWFEWGTNTTYGNATAPMDLGAGSQVVRVSTALEGFASGSVYHYRLVASNAFSVTWGADSPFTTGTRVANWGDYSQGYPAIPSGLDNVVEVASGHGHALVLRNDGTVAAWKTGFGYPVVGQTSVPPGLSNVVAVAGGFSHSLALKADGTVTTWGKYMYQNVPITPPPGLSNVIALAGGDSHSLALKSDGIVVAWGDNSSGQISVPSGLSNVVAVAAGSTHSLVLKANGTVVAWGSSFGGSVIPPTWLSNVVAISAESWHNLALRADGTVVGWGDNSFGQSTAPPGLNDAVAVAAGFRHSLALRADGSLLAWGDSHYVTNLPPGLAPVVSISSGDYHSQALSPVNLPPRVLSSLATGNTNMDLLISLFGWDPNGDPLIYRIAAPPGYGSLYQYTSTGRGDLINSPDEAVTDPSGRVVFAPLPDTFGARYSTFSVVANDGALDSPISLITVAIVPPPVIASAGLIQTPTPQGFGFSFPGLSNATYSAQGSADLTNWIALGSATQSSPGQFFFLDSGATNRPQRFYRVRSP